MANQPAVIDMDGIDESTDIYEDFHQTPASSSGEFGSSGGGAQTGGGNRGSPAQGVLGDTQNVMTKLMWEAGKTQAAKAWGIYGNIDLLRPYFDVEPKDVIKRCVQAFIPKPPTTTPLKIATELYGPTMLVMTLIALLLFEMKTSGHTVQEGTLIGTAFGTCFGYWLGCGAFVWMTAYVCNTHITFLQILSMLGYALVGHCVVVLFSTVVHTSHDHLYFYIIFAMFGGLTTLRMLSIIVSRTHGPSQKLVVCGVIAFLHLVFLLYLHFAYHQVVEEINEAIQDLHEGPASLAAAPLDKQPALNDLPKEE